MSSLTMAEQVQVDSSRLATRLGVKPVIQVTQHFDGGEAEQLLALPILWNEYASRVEMGVSVPMVYVTPGGDREYHKFHVTASSLPWLVKKVDELVYSKCKPGTETRWQVDNRVENGG